MLGAMVPGEMNELLMLGSLVLPLEAFEVPCSKPHHQARTLLASSLNMKTSIRFAHIHSRHAVKPLNMKMDKHIKHLGVFQHFAPLINRF